MNYLVWLVTAIHLLCVVLWVGGMAFLLLTLRASANAIEPSARLVLQGAVFRRFFRTTWQIMPMAVVSGLLLIILLYNHQKQPWEVMVMETGGVLMAAIFIGMVLVPNKRFQAKLASGTATVEDAAPVRRLLWLSLGIGAVILVCVANL
ncbi:hypothetical protein [Acidisoma sp.]|uniref:hypothetical protein n=1 Tax=Acidisoma sp. TaxID=1872115 RepID=UPI003AFF9D79